MSDSGRPELTLTRVRARIVELLRRAPATAAELATGLEMSYHAIRPHLAALERDRLVRVRGLRRGPTRPSAVYELAPGVEAALSKAYVPFAARLVEVLDERLSRRRVDGLMREVGRRLAGELAPLRGRLEERVAAASALLRDLGAPNEVERDPATFRIRAAGCLLAEAVHGRPGVCRAMEALLGDLLQAEVRERCDRGPDPAASPAGAPAARPRCCFEIRRAG
jgi:predicted ArsR family transcriptional regulator